MMSGSRRQKQGPHPSLSSLSLVSSAPMILVCPLPPSQPSACAQRVDASVSASQHVARCRRTRGPGAIVGGGQQKHHTRTHTHILFPMQCVFIRRSHDSRLEQLCLFSPPGILCIQHKSLSPLLQQYSPSRLLLTFGC